MAADPRRHEPSSEDGQHFACDRCGEHLTDEQIGESQDEALPLCESRPVAWRIGPPRDFITITCKHPGQPPPERCALLVSLPSGPIGIFYGTREECQAKADEVLREVPAATYEIQAMPAEQDVAQGPAPRVIRVHDAKLFFRGQEIGTVREATIAPRPAPGPRLYDTTGKGTISLTATWSSADPADREVQLERPQPKRTPRRLGWREKRRAAGAKRRASR